MLTVAFMTHLGAILGCGFLLSILFTWIIQIVWAWVNDSKVYHHNWMVSNILCSLFGFTERGKGSVYNYTSGSGSSSDGIFILLLLTAALSFVPLLVLLAVNNVAITITIALSICFMYALRFTRRLSKKFGIHVKDKDAHK